MDDSELFDVQKSEEKLASERLDRDQTQSYTGSVFSKRVSEIEGHVRENDAKMVSIHEAVVNRNAVLLVLRVLRFDHFQERELVLCITRHLLVTAQHFDSNSFVRCQVDAADHCRKHSLASFLHDLILVGEHFTDIGLVVPFFVVPVVLQCLILYSLSVA